LPASHAVCPDRIIHALPDLVDLLAEANASA
jgi:hypothetical protein